MKRVLCGILMAFSLSAMAVPGHVATNPKMQPVLDAKIEQYLALNNLLRAQNHHVLVLSAEVGWHLGEFKAISMGIKLNAAKAEVKETEAEINVLKQEIAELEGR